MQRGGSSRSVWCRQTRGGACGSTLCLPLPCYGGGFCCSGWKKSVVDFQCAGRVPQSSVFGALSAWEHPLVLQSHLRNVIGTKTLAK